MSLICFYFLLLHLLYTHRMAKETSNASEQAPTGSPKCKQGQNDIPTGVSHHVPYEHWSTDKFAKWCAPHFWDQEHLPYNNLRNETAEPSGERYPRKNATDPELIRRRKEITNAMIAKITQNKCRTTDELLQRLTTMEGKKTSSS